MRKDGLILAVVCLAGLLLRVGWVIYVDPSADNDAAAYRSLAMQLAEGKGYGGGDDPRWRPPGYAMILSVPYYLGASEEWGGRIVDIGASMLLPILLAGIVLVYAGRVPGFWALVFFMLNPIIIAHAAAPVSQGVAAVGMYAAILACLCIKPRQSPGIRLLLAGMGGAFLGFASLTRAESLVIFPFLAAFLVFRWRNRAGAVVACFLLGGMMVIAPWSLSSSKLYGGFVLISTNGGEVFFSANHVTDPEDGGNYNSENYAYLREKEPDPLRRNRLGFELAIQHILKRPEVFLGSLPHRLDNYLEGFRYLDGAGFMELQREPPKIFDRLFKFTYYAMMLSPFIFARRIWRQLRHGDGVALLLLSLYATYLALMPLFEVKNKNHYPFVWLLMLLVFLAVGVQRPADSIPEKEANPSTAG